MRFYSKAPCKSCPQRFLWKPNLTHKSFIEENFPVRVAREHEEAQQQNSSNRGHSHELMSYWGK